MPGSFITFAPTEEPSVHWQRSARTLLAWGIDTTWGLNQCMGVCYMIHTIKQHKIFHEELYIIKNQWCCISSGLLINTHADLKLLDQDTCGTREVVSQTRMYGLWAHLSTAPRCEAILTTTKVFSFWRFFSSKTTKNGAIQPTRNSISNSKLVWTRSEILSNKHWFEGILINMVDDWLNPFSMISTLTSGEVVERFYDGIWTLNIQLLSNPTRKTEFSKHVNPQN